PFLTLSVQVGTWQTSPVQTPLLQSPGSLHILRSSQGAHWPPQSRSVSFGSSMPLPHALSTHLFEATSQTDFFGSLQAAPSLHSPHLPAPSHTVPPTVHVAPFIAGSDVGVVPWQESTVHSFISSSGSISSGSDATTPPLHTFFLQSPSFCDLARPPSL